jgi:hypothetical protein
MVTGQRLFLVYYSTFPFSNLSPSPALNLDGGMTRSLCLGKVRLRMVTKVVGRAEIVYFVVLSDRPTVIYYFFRYRTMAPCC